MFLLAMEVKKFACEWQNHSLMSNEYVFQALYQSYKQQTELWKKLLG